MKQFTWMLIAAAVATAGCSDNDTSTPNHGNEPVWGSYTHAQLLKLKGNVKNVRMFYNDAEEQLLQLDASFDTKGRCTTYDPTGIDFTEEPSANRKVTRDWGVSAAHYTYSYDAQGRMARASKYEVGSDPVVFEITYGPHSAFVIAPFPLGDIAPFMLRGVTSITSTGYVLNCDGKTTTEEVTITGWRSSTKTQTSWSYLGAMPVKNITNTYALEEDGTNSELLVTGETTYTYRRNWLYRLETVQTETGEQSLRTVTEFSDKWPCTPLFRESYTGDTTDPNFRINYAYMDNGQPKNTEIVMGESFLDEPFEQHYITYDHAGNWTEAIRTMSAGDEKQEVSVVRSLIYY